jgi:hypothetical protein
MGCWYSWLTLLPCTQRSRVRIPDGPQTVVTRELLRAKWFSKTLLKFPYGSNPSVTSLNFLCLMQI